MVAVGVWEVTGQGGHGMACLSHTCYHLNPGQEPWRNWNDPVAGNTSQQLEFGSLPAQGHLATFSDPEFGHLKRNSNDHYGSSMSLGALLSARPCAEGLTCVICLNSKRGLWVGTLITPFSR